MAKQKNKSSHLPGQKKKKKKKKLFSGKNAENARTGTAKEEMAKRRKSKFSNEGMLGKIL